MSHLTILCLYPDEMNFYGDMGNVLAVRQRLKWRGMDAEVLYHHPGEAFPTQPVDLVLGGGGQDSSQRLVHKDLLANGSALRALAEQNVPMLLVCGLYQLFGNRFVTVDGQELKGIGLFDAETIAGKRRLVGDLVVQTPFGTLVGYENHSGRTVLAPGQPAFGTVRKGFGNNAASCSEGAVYRNAFGTYLHGAVLPRNPAFADVLLARALLHRDGFKTELPPLDNTLARRAAAVIYHGV